MIALDEYEAYWWSLRRSAELALFREQQSEIRRRDQFALVHLDDPKAKGLAHSHRFDAARDELIRRYSTTRRCPDCNVAPQVVSLRPPMSRPGSFTGAETLIREISP